MKESVLTYALLGLGTLFWTLMVNLAVDTAGHLIDLIRDWRSWDDELLEEEGADEQ